MPRGVDFIFDFGSPNAYLSHKVLTQIAARTGATVNLVPCLLGGIFKLSNNQSPMTAFSSVKGKMEYENLETKRFIEKHGLNKFTFNPHFPVNTLQIMRGMVAARFAGVEKLYVETVLSAMWETGKNMMDSSVILEVLDAAGLDGNALMAATQDAEVKAELIKNTEAVVARGAFGIPTFFVGDEMFFGKDRLWQVEEALTNAK